VATIDDKVVAMSFESSKFEAGVNKSLTAIEKLKTALNFPNAGKGLNEVDAAARKLSFAHLASSIDDIKNRLNAFRLVAIAVFAQVAQKALAAGVNFAKAFTLDPLKAGFTEYTTNLNAVQTILANTQAAGVKLNDVNKALKVLNDYSDRTIYNFSQMAKNIGTFTAAGVELDTATQAIKGIANLAALSGSNAEQASTAMYQLSQAISAGRVSLQDWNSVVNAGMGGTVFQRALAQTAEAMGTLKDGTVKLTGPMKNVTIAGESFRQSLQAGPGKTSWLTSEVLTKTLEQFTGDLTDAQLKAEGFNDAQIKAIQQTAKTAMHAATEVKTLSQVLAVAKETAGSGWAQTWQIIFGDFAEAKSTFTALSNTINGFINVNADARNKVLADWKELGGRTVLINAIKTAFANLSKILAPIKQAFRDIFPPTTGKNLFDLTVRFKEFADALQPSAQTVENLKRTFRGLFALLDIGKQILSGIFSVFARLFGVLSEGSGGFLNFTGNIGDFLVSVDEMLKKGQHIERFFNRLADILTVPAQMLKTFNATLIGLFSGLLPGGLAKQMSGLGESLSPLQLFVNNLAKQWNALLTRFSDTARALGPAFDAIIELINGIGIAIGEAATNMNFDAILEVVRTGLLVGLVTMFKQFLGKGSLMQQLGGAGGGILGNIAGTFDALRGSMVAMQNNIKADTLKKIAIAIALLTASVVALSFVDPERLKSSLTAMTVAFGQLLGAMAILGNISKTVGFVKMPILSASLIMLAGAITILSVAVLMLSRLSWEDLLKGLGGVAALLSTMVVSIGPLSANSAGLIRAGIGITVIAVALNLLALAVRQFASMNMSELVKGLGSIAISLNIMVKTLSTMAKMKGLQVSTLALVIMAGALNLLALAVRQFASMNMAELAKGLGAMAISLGIMAAALFALSKVKGLQVTAIQLIAVAIALNLIAKAISTMAGMSAEQLARGLIAIAVALGLLGGAMFIFSKIGMSGAAALGVAAGALSLLIPMIVLLGKQSWTTIIKGLVGLGIAMAALAIAGQLMTPAVPGLLGLGAALLLIGGGLALAGAGIFLLAAGLSALIVALPTGVGVLVAAFVELQKGIIENIKLLVLGLLEIVQAFAATAPKFVAALVKILDSLIDVVIQSAPKIAQAFTVLLTQALQVLKDNQPKLIQAGFDLLVDLLKGIRNNIPQIVTIVVDIVTKFLSSLSNNMNRIVTAGGNLLISFLRGIANNLGNVITAVVSIITKFVSGIANNLGRVALAGLSVLARFLQAIASRLGDVIKAGTDIIVKFITGIGNAGPRIITAAVTAITKFIHAISQGAVKLADEGMKAVINFLNGVAAAIEANSGEMRAAGIRIAVAIIDGMTFGLASKAGDVVKAAGDLGKKALKALGKAIKFFSPSHETYVMGEALAQGLANGMSDDNKAVASAEELGNSVISGFNDVFEIASPSKVMYNIGKFVGLGFADGLKGSAEDINRAFSDLKTRLKDQMVATRADIAQEQDRLAELLKAKQDKLDAISAKKWKNEADKAQAIAAVQKQYAQSIKESEDAIKASETTLARLNATHKTLTKSLQDEKSALIKVANDFDKVTEKLKEAQRNLEALKKERDDFAKTTADRYATPPEISKPLTEEIADARAGIAKEQDKLNKLLSAGTQDLEQIAAARISLADAQGKLSELTAGKVLTADGSSVDIVATYLQDLKNQVTAVSTYAATLDQLRKLGLDDETYRRLVEEGTADQEFANKLLAGGKKAIGSLNTLDSDLKTEAEKLGTTSASELYKVGIAAAEGFVQGFEKDRAVLLKKVRQLGLDIIKELKKSLKIKSPSEEFAEIGAFAMSGLAKGFDDEARGAVLSMQKTMDKLTAALATEINPEPVITPVLDLTTVRTQAGELAALTSTTPIAATASFNQASIISSAQTAAQAEEAVAAAAGTSVTFEQNNYSPEALSDVEIYRQTRNQLSQLKSVLAPT